MEEGSFFFFVVSSDTTRFTNAILCTMFRNEDFRRDTRHAGRKMIMSTVIAFSNAINMFAMRCMIDRSQIGVSHYERVILIGTQTPVERCSSWKISSRR